MSAAVLMDLRASEADDGYPVGSCSATGGASGAFHGPDGYSLWVATATLEPGATLTWSQPHGDEIVYIRKGRLRFGDKTLGAECVAVVEAAGNPVCLAEERTTLVHFGETSPQARTDKDVEASPGVHLVNEKGTFGGVFESEYGPVHSWFYADSTCSSCRPTLLRNSASNAYRTASHSHSQDEIMFMIAGDMQVGRLDVKPGMALAIPQGHRYGFRSKHGFDFINYRAELSTFVMAPGSTPIIETATGLGMEPRLQ